MKNIYKMFYSKGNFFYHKTVLEKAAVLHDIAKMVIMRYRPSGIERMRDIRKQAEFLDKWKTG